VRPIASWDEWSASATPIFQGFRSDKGEAMILDRNMFVDRVLPGSVLRKLTEAEMTEYRRPYLRREDRWPTLTWPRQIPISGEPPKWCRYRRIIRGGWPKPTFRNYSSMPIPARF